MSNLREWLTGLGFDWKNGTIIYHAVSEESYCPGWGASDVQSREVIPAEHPVLDEEFDSGYGSPQCPRIVAFDDEAVYFPTQYDGATGMERVFLDPKQYLLPDSESPYPGG